MTCLYFIVLCACITTAFGSVLQQKPLFAKNSGRIIGGSRATPAMFPYAAAIKIQTSEGRFFCGGTLVDQKWIVTAGHCVNNGVSFNIQLGSNSLKAEDKHRVIFNTTTYYVHPDFNPDTLENDIGLIKLKKNVEYNFFVGPAVLEEYDIPDRHYAFVFGWGQTSDSNTDLSDELRFAFIPSISNSDCKKFYGNQITDNTLCVIGKYNQGACTGDSGGGYVTHIDRKHILAAVSSFLGANGCENDNPSGYIRTLPYISWIKEVISSK